MEALGVESKLFKQNKQFKQQMFNSVGIVGMRKLTNIPDVESHSGLPNRLWPNRDSACRSPPSSSTRARVGHIPEINEMISTSTSSFPVPHLHIPEDLQPPALPKTLVRRSVDDPAKTRSPYETSLSTDRRLDISRTRSQSPVSPLHDPGCLRSSIHDTIVNSLDKNVATPRSDDVGDRLVQLEETGRTDVRGHRSASP